MHQAVRISWDDCCDAAPATYGRSARCKCRRSGSAAGGAGLGLAVLTCDPLIDSVYRSGLLSLKDLRSLVGCTRSQAIQGVAQERARTHLGAAAAQLRSMRGAFELCAARVRGLALDAEARLLQLGVPMNAVHPELSSRLRDGEEAAHHALYAGLLTLNQVLRAASHPATWAEQPGGVWEALAASTGLSIRPQLVLLLSSLLPVEARMSYLSLRHEAYSHGMGRVCDLGGLVKSVLLRMMLYPYGPQDLRRLTKQLKQVAPRLSPFSFWLLRQCASGSTGSGQQHANLAQRQAQRAAEEAWLGAQIDDLFAQRQEQVLYTGEAWIGWLHSLPTRYLVAFYIKYLFDSFQ